MSDGLKLLKPVQTFRRHRFILTRANGKQEDNFLLLKGIRWHENHEIGLIHYLSESNIKFITDKKYPNILEIQMLDGYGKSKSKVVLRGVRFIRNQVEDIKFSYTNCGIQTMEVLLGYTEADLVLV